MKYLACLSLLLAMAGAHGAERSLPPLELSDSAAQPANLVNLGDAPKWILVVVDPARAQTQAALARLDWEADGRNAHVVMVAVGADAPFQALVKRLGTRSGARFYRDATGSLPKALQLPGLPAVLGMTDDNRIAWQVIGLPPQQEKARSLFDSWLLGRDAAAAVQVAQ